MYDLIFRFLLDSGFPRGSILTDHAEHSSEQIYHPAFLIVDPGTVETLAVIDVVESATVEQLSSHALHTGRFAANIGHDGVQSFVIQVDSSHPEASEQVRFYKLLPGKKMQQISSYAFPDLEALQVARKLKNKIRHNPGLAERTEHESGTAVANESGSRLSYFLAFVLVLICALDWVLLRAQGSSVFTLQQILLLISAAAMLAVPMLTRQLKR